MNPMYLFVQRLIGTKEITGSLDNPFILWCLELDDPGIPTPLHDEIAWCSALLNRAAWCFRMPRSKSWSARSWLQVGVPVQLRDAQVGDVVIFKRGSGVQPGPEVIKAPGHVGLFSAYNLDSRVISSLGGNQSNGITVANFSADLVLGIRRLVA